VVENLGLGFQAAKSAGMDDAIAIARVDAAGKDEAFRDSAGRGTLPRASPREQEWGPIRWAAPSYSG